MSEFHKVDYKNETDNNSVSCTSIGVLNSQTHAHKMTLLYKLGGREMLKRAVDIYYEKIVNDDLLKPYFVLTDMKLLKWHQYNFMSVAFDNTITNYFDLTDLILNRHQRLFDNGLCEKHFDRMMNHFQLTFMQLTVQRSLIDEALMILNRLRPIFMEGAIQAQTKNQASKSRCKLHLQMVVITLVSIGAIQIYRSVMVHK